MHTHVSLTSAMQESACICVETTHEIVYPDVPKDFRSIRSMVWLVLPFHASNANALSPSLPGASSCDIQPISSSRIKRSPAGFVAIRLWLAAGIGWMYPGRPAIDVSAGSTRMDKTAVPRGVFWPDHGQLRLVLGSRSTPAMSTTERCEVLGAWTFSCSPCR